MQALLAILLGFAPECERAGFTNRAWELVRLPPSGLDEQPVHQPKQGPGFCCSGEGDRWLARFCFLKAYLHGSAPTGTGPGGWRCPQPGPGRRKAGLVLTCCSKVLSPAPPRGSVTIHPTGQGLVFQASGGQQSQPSMAGKYREGSERTAGRDGDKAPPGPAPLLNLS